MNPQGPGERRGAGPGRAEGRDPVDRGFVGYTVRCVSGARLRGDLWKFDFRLVGYLTPPWAHSLARRLARTYYVVQGDARYAHLDTGPTQYTPLAERRE